VRREREMPLPTRPRFDHVAITVADRDAVTRHLEARFDFRPIGLIDPSPDPNAPAGWMGSEWRS